jgi:hypothetical protein
MKPSTIDQYAQSLVNDNGMIELREQGPEQKVWRSSWHDSAQNLQEAASAKSGHNLYTSLNAPKLRSLSSTDPVRNSDILRITRIPFDFDPVRPIGKAATPEEIQAAYERRVGAAQYLQGVGWPLPLVAKSGNGHHLQYRTALPANDQTAAMMKIIYRGMADLFDDDVVKFDQVVRNPGRIFRLYGFPNYKGGEERDTAVWMPPRFQQVSHKQVEHLAHYFAQQLQPKQAVRSSQSTAKRLTGRGDYNTLDIVSWFASHGLYEHHVEDNIHAVVCPWEHEHSESNPNDTLIFEDPDGWGGFYCHHSHCQGRNLRDVMEMLGDADTFCSTSFGGAA